MVIPNLFYKAPIPKKIPLELETKIKEFALSQNKKRFLKNAFFYIVRKWGGNRFNVIWKLPRLFQQDLDTIMHTDVYLHCTTMNYLLRVMLVKSKLFNDDDIQLKLTNTRYIAPHQYLAIKISNDEQITLDPWNYQFGIDYGKYGSGFDSVKITPIR